MAVKNISIIFLKILKLFKKSIEKNIKNGKENSKTYFGAPNQDFEIDEKIIKYKVNKNNILNFLKLLLLIKKKYNPKELNIKI